MGQSKPFRATALVVEDDPMQREMICLLLEESDMDVIVTSVIPLRQELPDGAKFWTNPCAPLDVIREAERVAHQLGADGDNEPPRRQ